MAIERHTFDITEVVEGVVALLTPQAAAKHIRIEAEWDSEIPRRLLGDYGRIRQVLMNLAGNAVKFTEHGEVRITLTTLDRREGSIRLQVRVQDTGIGIPAEDQARLFEKFTQADASITRRFGGTGLGLAICKRLLDLMDGEIGVESENGRGSTFWFSLWLPVDGPPFAHAELPRLETAEA
jgi:two-component system sensor histidine kinase/response regulator